MGARRVAQAASLGLVALGVALALFPSRRQQAFRYLWDGNAEQRATQRKLRSAAAAIQRLEDRLKAALGDWEAARGRGNLGASLRPMFAQIDSEARKVELYLDSIATLEDEDRAERRRLNDRLNEFFETMESIERQLW
uniref:Uncharacterized protein n=1 Tax=Phaeomonas parva TaxID=124430 RepID=A0A7S1U992_9STRA|mmetsp:Transcript_37703/g.118012  ORF Transcript_37703/g.118012 Transcript_37703/m.118012 type:complete len:138 (+) Transcript_37703:169-582(+)